MAAVKPWSHLEAPRRLRQWRISRDLTQRAAAELLEVDAQRLCNFELERRRPDLDLAAHIERKTKGYVKAIQWAQDRKAA